MPLNSIGYDGTVNEAGMARLLGMLGQPFTVTSRSAFAAAQISGLRSIRIAAGSDEYAYAGGVAVNNTTAIDQAIPGPASGAGQFFLVVLRRTFDTNTNTIEVLKADLTSAAPLAVPASYPSDFQSRPGIIVDQPLYWAWTNTTNLAVQLVDLRVLSPATPRRGTADQRDTYYGGTPAFLPAQRARQAAEWFNTDTNLTEVYMAPYNATSNPGGVVKPGTAVAGTAGWYSVGSNGAIRVLESRFPLSMKLVPGSTNVVDKLDISFGQGRFLHFRHVMRWLANGNAAGTMLVRFDGTALPDQLRVHSEGGPAKMVLATLEYDLWVPAGTHLVEVVYSSESASTDAYKQDALTVVTGVAR